MPKSATFMGLKKKSVFVHVIMNISIKLFFLYVIYLLSLTVKVVILKNIFFSFFFILLLLFSSLQCVYYKLQCSVSSVQSVPL